MPISFFPHSDSCWMRFRICALSFKSYRIACQRIYVKQLNANINAYTCIKCVFFVCLFRLVIYKMLNKSAKWSIKHSTWDCVRAGHLMNIKVAWQTVCLWVLFFSMNFIHLATTTWMLMFQLLMRSIRSFFLFIHCQGFPAFITIILKIKYTSHYSVSIACVLYVRACI